VRGALIDLVWKAPDWDPAERQLVGFELFRDDMSARPTSRRTWKTMPGNVFEVRGLEDLPDSEYGVQPIWRLYAVEPPYVIEFGPPSLPSDLAGKRPAVLPPEERIHALAWLQRDGLITSADLELAVGNLMASQALPEAVARPARGARNSGAAGSTTPARARGVMVAYVAVAVVMVLALVVGAPYLSRLLFTHQSPVVVSATPSPAPASPTPTPSARAVNLRPVLIKPTDLRAGYVAGPYDSNPLCTACVPASSSLSVVLQNRQLKRVITTGATVAPNTADSSGVVRALTTGLSSGKWARGKLLGDESFTYSNTRSGLTSFYVVWRAGVITQEVVLVAPQGSRTLQDAIDLAKLQQVRAAALRI
jgi:hypothetical protein